MSSDSLNTLMAYIKAFGEVPAPSELVDFSCSNNGVKELNSTESKHIINIYQKNLQDFRSGKVMYSPRSRTVSYPQKYIKSESKHNTNLSSPNDENIVQSDIGSITSNVVHSEEIETNICINMSMSIASNPSNSTTPSIDTQSDKVDDDHNLSDNDNTDQREEHKNNIFDENDSKQVLMDDDMDNMHYIDDMEYMDNTDNMDNMDNMDDMDDMGNFAEIEIKEEEDECCNVINTESKNKKSTKKEKKRIPKELIKNTNKIKENQPDGIWSTIWSLFGPPDVICTCSDKK